MSEKAKVKVKIADSLLGRYELELNDSEPSDPSLVTISISEAKDIDDILSLIACDRPEQFSDFVKRHAVEQLLFNSGNES